MTKLPAGNTGRHEESILWDRLRADLEKLGAQYGELSSPATSQPEPFERASWDMPVSFNPRLGTRAR